MSQSLLKKTNMASVALALRGWVLPVVLLLVWWAAVAWKWTSSPILVSPIAVWDRAVEQVLSGHLSEALLASLHRGAYGFAWGSSAGFLLGSLLGLSRLFEKLIAPSFHTFKQISLFAWIPLLSMWFGVGDESKIAFIALAAFFPVVLNTFEGFRSVPRESIEVARVFAYIPTQLWLRVVFPSAAPSVLTGIHLSLIYTWLATLGAEYLMSSGKGIGNTLIEGREHFLMDLVLFGVLVIGSIGFLLNYSLSILERHVLAWRQQTIARY